MICLFIILLVCHRSIAVAQSTCSGDTSTVSTINPINSEAFSFDKSTQSQSNRKSLYILPANQYSKTLGFFCKKELELEKAIKLPVRFRLGSVAYTDRMENKNNFRPTDTFKNR
jgi:hypothetical protein